MTNDGGATIDDATTASCTSETVPSAPVSMSATIVNRNPVFLQTIRVAVSSGAGNMCAEANILFDLGSQKTYIRENLVSRLNLKPAKRELVNIGAFGAKTGTIKSLEVFPFSLVGTDGKEIALQGDAVPTICAPLDDYRMCVNELKNRYHLEEYLPGSQMITGEIDILVGGDFYWSIMSRESIGLTENLVLKPSRVGYMLSGSENPLTTVSAITIHIGV